MGKKSKTSESNGTTDAKDFIEDEAVEEVTPKKGISSLLH